MHSIATEKEFFDAAVLFLRSICTGQIVAENPKLHHEDQNDPNVSRLAIMCACFCFCFPPVVCLYVLPVVFFCKKTHFWTQFGDEPCATVPSSYFCMIFWIFCVLRVFIARHVWCVNMCFVFFAQCLVLVTTLVSQESVLYTLYLFRYTHCTCQCAFKVRPRYLLSSIAIGSPNVRLHVYLTLWVPGTHCSCIIIGIPTTRTCIFKVHPFDFFVPIYL